MAWDDPTALSKFERALRAAISLREAVLYLEECQDNAATLADVIAEAIKYTFVIKGLEGNAEGGVAQTFGVWPNTSWSDATVDVRLEHPRKRVHIIDAKTDELGVQSGTAYLFGDDADLVVDSIRELLDVVGEKADLFVARSRVVPNVRTSGELRVVHRKRVYFIRVEERAPLSRDDVDDY